MGCETQTPLRAVGSTSRRPPKGDNGQSPNIYIDYSHRGVGPYGPEAYSQIPRSDDYLYTDDTYPEAISA